MNTELQKLLSRKKELDQAYYQQHQSLVSDQEYDELVRQIAAAGGGTEVEIVGSDLSGDFAKVKHRAPMLSINNTYSEADTRDFIRGVEEEFPAGIAWAVEPKIDGLSLTLWYENGVLLKALTRGNGSVGDDVTHNALQIKGIPQHLPPGNDNDLEVRGEVYLSRSRFRILNQERLTQAQALFANPRNAASGTLKMKDPAEVKRRQLGFFAYQLLADKLPDSHMSRITMLKEMGFPVNPHIRSAKSSEEILAAIRDFKDLRATLDYDTDGMVIKLDSHIQREELGNTAKSPRWLVAYKYEAEMAVTTLKAVSLQVGRTGVITPVAELEEVLLAGSKVKRASLHNFQLIQEKHLRLGVNVCVQKAGEIIPQVLGLASEADFMSGQPIPVPEHCPCCQSRLQASPPPSPALLCTNRACPDRLKAAVIYFCGKSGLDIEGLGIRVIEQLLDAGLVKGIGDVFRLQKTDLLTLEGFAEKSASQLITEIEKARSCSFPQVLTALGIPGLGRQTVLGLCQKFSSMDELEKAGDDQLTEIDGIGPILANNLREWLANPVNAGDWRELAAMGLNFSRPIGEEADVRDLPLAGLSFVITGSFELPREKIQKAIEKLGGNVKSAISAKIDVLISGDKAGSKLTKAQKLGIRIVTDLSELLQPRADHENSREASPS